MKSLDYYKDMAITYGTRFRRWVCKHAFRNPDYTKDMTWQEVGNYVALVFGAVINFLASLLKIVCGFIFDSAWLSTIGFYYLLLSGIRFMLLYREWRKSRKDDQKENNLYGYRSCRDCGIMMLLLNFVLTGMGIPMIYENPFHAYPRFLMTLFMIVAVYNFFVCLWNMAKFIKLNNPILTAARRVSMVTALVSAYSLETAWVARYGMPTNYYLSRIMNAVTGSLICFLIFMIALSMIIQASHAISVEKRRWKNMAVEITELEE